METSENGAGPDPVGSNPQGSPAAMRIKSAPGPRKQEKMKLIMSLHKQGVPMEEIRERVGLANATFHTYITELGLAAQRKKATRSQNLAEIKALHDEGMDLEEICNTLEIAPQRFAFYLKLLGIEHEPDLLVRMQIRSEIRNLKEGAFDLNAMAERLGISVEELLQHLQTMSL